MTNMKPYCVECEVRMRCERNGVVIPYGDDHVQRGDLYKCPICGTRIIVGFGEPYIRW